MIAVSHYLLSLLLMIVFALLPSKALPGIAVCPKYPGTHIFFQHKDSPCPSCNRAIIPLPQTEHYRGWNQSALRVFKKLAGKNTNHIFSPHSIFETVTLLGAGAAGRTQELTLGVMGAKAETFEQFTQIAQSGLAEHGGITSKANAMIVSNARTLRPHYRQFLRQYDKSVQILEGVNFSDSHVVSEVVELVNNMVCTTTNNMIQQCLGSDDLKESTVLAAVNTSYFEGEWEDYFSNKMGHFTPFSEPPINIRMIEATSNRMYYSACQGWEAVLIPYRRGADMVIMIPPQGTRPSDITEDVFENLQRGLKKAIVHLVMPEYMIDMQYALEEHLDREAFDMFSADADFSEMVENAGVSVSTMKHAAMIRTNEYGTKVASSTLSFMAESEYTVPIQQVAADHPFLFFISDKTPKHTVRFMGQVWNPQEESAQ